MTVARFAYDDVVGEDDNDDDDDDDDDDDKCLGFMAPRVLPLLPSTLFLCRVLNYCCHIFLSGERGQENFDSCRMQRPMFAPKVFFVSKFSPIK